MSSPINRAEQRTRKRTVLPPKVAQALEYISRNFAEDTRLDEMADLVKMNKCSFCRLFKQATRMTFTQYLNSLRLEEAKTLLQTSDAHIFHIAHTAGFKDSNYFGVLFRRCYGCSPSEYRDRLRPSPR